MSYAQSSTEALLKQTINVGVSLGKSAAHSLYPNNYEYYLCSYELFDSSNVLLGLFSFTVMPNSIMENEAQIANIIKTNKSVVTVFNDSFVPKDISIQGTFGRKFRLIIGDKEVGFSGKDLSYGNLSPAIGGNQILVKSGYGMTKTLEKIIKASWKLDANGSPCFLIFRNYSLNHHYIVEIMQHSFSQSMDTNMMWNYSIEMKAVAPASALWAKDASTNISSTIGRVAAAAASSSVNKLLSSVKRSLLKF